MNFLESLKSAFQSIKGNKIRSFLTMLGIIIGISSVITMSSIGKGGQHNITGDLKSSGYGKFNISVDKSDENFRWKYLLDEKIVEKLKKSNKFRWVSPKISIGLVAKLKDGKRKEVIRVNPTNYDFEKIDEIELLYGRNILNFEYENGEQVITIDNVTAKTFFGDEKSAVGKKFDLSKGWKGGTKTYRVVGVFKNPFEKMIKVMGGKRVPRFGRIPISTYEKLYDKQKLGYTTVILEGKNPENINQSILEAKNILSDVTENSEIYDISAENNKASSFDNILTTINIFVTFVAGISLFVGGIGVMNIMLVSVVERTKEIGIRKAIGATNFDILLQFLMESVILTAIGGISGIILGVLLAILLGNLIGIIPIFSVFTIIISFVISMLIGVIFGVAPAKKASDLNPIDALRAE